MNVEFKVLAFEVFKPTQNTLIVMTVRTIIAKPNMNPTLNVSICLTHANGEKAARTINPKYSCFRSLSENRASIVDFIDPITNASCAIVN